MEGSSKDEGLYDPVGAGAGSFVIYPSADLMVEQIIDYAFALPEDESSDIITHVVSGVEVPKNWNHHAVAFSRAGDTKRQNDEDGVDSLRGLANGSNHFDSRSTFAAGIRIFN